MRSTSFSRPMTGSRSCWRAICVRSRPNCSRIEDRSWRRERSRPRCRPTSGLFRDQRLAMLRITSVCTPNRLMSTCDARPSSSLRSPRSKCSVPMYSVESARDSSSASSSTRKPEEESRGLAKASRDWPKSMAATISRTITCRSSPNSRSRRAARHSGKATSASSMCSGLICWCWKKSASLRASCKACLPMSVRRLTISATWLLFRK